MSISLILIITFSLLAITEKTIGSYFKKLNEMQETYLEPGHKLLTREEFFSSDFTANRTIFLLGSSHVGHLNVTTINNLILSNFTNTSDVPITVYNLGRAGNTPIQELEELEQIISARPEMVFYGISYWEFAFPYVNDKDSILPDPELIISNALHSGFDDFIPSNPQWLTRAAFSEITKIPQEKQPHEFLKWTTLPKTPFYPYAASDARILTDDELRKENLLSLQWSDSLTQHRNIDALHKIIQQLRSEDIEIVIFSMPLHKYYLEALSDNQKKSFSALLDDLAEKYDLEIYEFEEKYAELDVWGDIEHVSYHKNVTIFNEDVAKMIIMETIP